MSYSDHGTVFGRLLAQSEPATTSATQVFTPSEKNRRVVITHITIVNHSGGNVVCTIYHDDDGTTYSTATEVYRQAVSQNETLVQNVYWPVAFGGNIAVQSGAANDVTFTLYGTDYVQSR